MKIEINTRCPLQSECGRKNCKFQHHERDCKYYQGNSRPGAEIEDQEAAMEAEWEARLADTSVLADQSATATSQDTEPVVVQGDTGSLVLLPVDQLLPHPDNPRKDLGDLQELADSIKANGVLQNLTVVSLESEAAEWSALSQQYQEHPTEEVRNLMNRITANQPKDSEGLFRVVIGHRRLAAAKLAGLAEVPCVISHMDYREQVRTMLMENIQRADLTVYEQAQGFQMMLDLGDNVAAIAKKSGFSKSTVRRRVKLLELDQEKFKASVERGATLQDYVELDKIEDLELKNKVLDSIGTNNFRMMLNNAIQTEKDRKYIADAAAAVAEFATLVEEADRSVLEYQTSYEPWNKKKVKRPDDADAVKYFYTASDRAVTVYRDRTETAEDTAAQEALARRKADFERKTAELEKITETTYDLRADFIKQFSSAKKNLTTIIQYACSAIISDSPYYQNGINTELLAELLGLEIDDNTDYPTFKAMVGVYSADRPEYTLLASTYAFMENGRNSYYTFNWENGCSICVYRANENLDRLYEFLASLGYQMSDEEKALQDGTHELFQNPEPSPQPEQEVVAK